MKKLGNSVDHPVRTPLQQNDPGVPSVQSLRVQIHLKLAFSPVASGKFCMNLWMVLGFPDRFPVTIILAGVVPLRYASAP